MKIAIVGAGIAGLTAASVLGRKHDIRVLEAAKRIGGHANTVTVRDNGAEVAVDTGFIVFNEPNYPNLLRLFDRHDVPVQNSDMSFSVHEQATGFEYNAASFDSLFAQRKNALRPRFWRMLADIVKFHREAPRDLGGSLAESVTVAQYVQRNRYGRHFCDHYLVPLGASLWSCDAHRFNEFPMRFVLEFLDNHHMLQVNNRPQWKTVQGGSREYVRRLVTEFEDRVQLDCEVKSVKRGARQIEVILADGRQECFDEVVLACHADQAMRMVQGLESDEHEVLSCFPYQRNEVALHTDTALLPRHRKAWASWNYRIPAARGRAVAVTYNMNKLQALDAERTYCVSLNQTAELDSRSVIGKFVYEHPSFTVGRGEAQDRHAAMVRRRGLSYCGAYWGFGFHEDGVRSGLEVCRAYDMDLDS